MYNKFDEYRMTNVFHTDTIVVVLGLNGRSDIYKFTPSNVIRRELLDFIWF